MKKDCAYLLYDPLSLTTSLLCVGGAESQTCSTVTGELLFDPDRTLTPLVLRPTLWITDPDKVLTDGDHSADIVSVHWYLGTDSSGELILSDNKSYQLSDNGELQVWKNISPDSPQPLYFEGKFLDPRTDNVYSISHTITLTSALSKEVKLHLQTDWVNPMAIPALKNLGQRTLNVELYNGEQRVDDAYARYRWLILDTTAGGFREIGDEDLCYVAGQGTRSLTIDRRFIDKERIVCEAYLSGYPNLIQRAYCKAYRDYGQWEVRGPVFTTGRFFRATTESVTVEAQITTPKGQLSAPEEHFDITHYLIGPTGAEEVISYGQSATVDGDKLRQMDTRQPIFGVDVSTRSALRACTIDGAIATINGQTICLRVPIVN